MEKEKFCIVCGRRIPKTSERRKICSIACGESRKRGYAPYEKFKSPPFDELTQLQQKAQARGMSYGKYMAMKNNTNIERMKSYEASTAR